MKKIKIWLMAFRPKTLVAAIVPILAATSYFYYQNASIAIWISLFALGSALFIQIGTNLVNDSIDFEKGADTKERVGPQRVTQSGLISSKAVMTGGFLCFALALLLGIPLVLQGGWPFVAIGIASLFLGYGYTGGPFPLAYLGLGDFFVILFFGLIATGGVYYLQALAWDSSILVLGLQVGCLATVLIAINNLRDIHQDKKVDKKTLAVRFGEKFVKLEILALLLVTYLIGIYWLYLEIPYAGLLPLLTLPLAFSIGLGIWNNSPGKIYNKFLAKAGALQLLFGILVSLGFLVQRQIL